MTEKKEKILMAALELFAKEGFQSTSTSKVAKTAGVSEGLIFRHFTNKEGLLEAIIQSGEERVKDLFADVLLEKDPKKVISKTLELGDKMNDSVDDANFWKLQYKIKWETENYNAQKMEPLKIALREAFSGLSYKDPEMEAERLLATLDGLATKFYLMNDYDVEPVLHYLKEQYQL